MNSPFYSMACARSAADRISKSLTSKRASDALLDFKDDGSKMKLRPEE